MGVYINMEMPKDCRHCRFMCQKFGELRGEIVVVHMCACCSQGTAEPEYNNTRAPYCPLVELLPHGRLIDADRLAFAMMDAANADQALAMVDDAPTVIPAEDES